MKKNLISIIILALLIVNIVLTSLMMFSVMGASKATSTLVTDIASALKLDLGTGTKKTSEEIGANVPMKDTEVYNIQEAMVITLKRGEGEPLHYCSVMVSLSMNNAHEDFKEYGDLSTKEGLIRDEIIAVFSKYTLQEVQGNPDMVKQEILERLQDMYDSDFIFGISFRDIQYM